MDNNKNIIESPEDLTVLINTTPCVIIKFSASWCGPCKKIKQPWENLRSKYFSDYIKFIEFDIDDDESIIDSKKYYDIKVRSVPYFLVSTNGAFTSQFTGGESIGKIDLLLTKLLSEIK